MEMCNNISMLSARRSDNKELIIHLITNPRDRRIDKG